VKGRVIPVSTTKSTLCARYENGNVTRGEPAVDEELFHGKKIERLFLEPQAQASEKAVRAIEQADILCIGPGSFYTSILPNFLPLGIREATAASPAPVILITNLLTEGLGMKELTITDITRIVEEHIGREVARVVANIHTPDDTIIGKYKKEHKDLLLPEENRDLRDRRIITAPLWGDDTAIARHDPALLSHAIFHSITELLKRC